jgi:hypothetical protein
MLIYLTFHPGKQQFPSAVETSVRWVGYPASSLIATK